MLHTLASVIAWIIALAIGLGLLGLLVWLLRVILRDSVGKPRLRALMLSAVTFGLFALWSVSRIVPSRTLAFRPAENLRLGRVSALDELPA